MPPHQRWVVDAPRGGVLRVSSDTRARLLLLSPGEYMAYADDRPWRAVGRELKSTVTFVRLPRSGVYYVALDLWGRTGRVVANVTLHMPPPRVELERLHEAELVPVGCFVPPAALLALERIAQERRVSVATLIAYATLRTYGLLPRRAASRASVPDVLHAGAELGESRLPD